MPKQLFRMLSSGIVLFLLTIEAINKIPKHLIHVSFRALLNILILNKEIIFPLKSKTLFCILDSGNTKKSASLEYDAKLQFFKEIVFNQ